MTYSLARKMRVTALLTLTGVFAIAPSSHAQVSLGPVTVGAGVQTSFLHTQPSGGSSTDEFQLNSVRLYINGPVTENIKFMFNTEFDGATNKVGILDAVGQYSYSPKLNIWVGRFLPPSDRANLYGPYYSNQWGVYTDGIQDGYPFAYTGRDNGAMYWGQFDKVKVSFGVFDGKSTDGNKKLLGAGRVQVDFWDKEDGYYLNGTYYGDKNLLAIGGATQFQSGNTAFTADFLLEKKLPNNGVVAVESEYSYYNGLGGYDANYKKSKGGYGLASYLFPKKIGIGNVQLLGKFASADFTEGKTVNYSQKTTEINLNYVIKQHKARVMSFFRNASFDHVKKDSWVAGVGFQFQI